mgnify:CR=1 FL=1
MFESSRSEWITLVFPTTDPKTLKCPLASRLYHDLASGLGAVGSAPQDAKIVIVVPNPDTVADLECSTLLLALDEVRRMRPDAHVLVWMGSIRKQFSHEGLRDIATCRDASVKAGGGMLLMETQAPLHNFMLDNKFMVIRGVADALKLVPVAAMGNLQPS